jgi:hypothetical protein
MRQSRHELMPLLPSRHFAESRTLPAALAGECTITPPQLAELIAELRTLLILTREP